MLLSRRELLKKGETGLLLAFDHPNKLYVSELIATGLIVYGGEALGCDIYYTTKSGRRVLASLTKQEQTK